MLYGFKAIELKNGILRSKTNGNKQGIIFEIGIESQYSEVCSGISFAENGYSFCDSIDEVWDHEADFINPLDERRFRDVRLFRIKTSGLVIGDSSHRKAERITVIDEVIQSELVEYFCNKTFIDKDKFIRYKNSNISPYKAVLSERDILDIPVKNCFCLYQKDMCFQSSNGYELKLCEKCNGYKLINCAHSHMDDYYYLQCRRKLYEGQKLDTIDEYQKIRDNEIYNSSINLIEKYVRESQYRLDS